MRVTKDKYKEMLKRLADVEDRLSVLDAESVWIAVKREHRGLVPDDWQDQVQDMGAKYIGGSDLRMKVSATAQQLDEIRAKLGDRFHVEQSMVHRAMADAIREHVIELKAQLEGAEIIP